LEKIIVRLREKQYSIYIEKGLLDEIGSQLKRSFDVQKIAVITDQYVDRFYGERFLNSLKKAAFTPFKIVIPPGEKSKNFSMLINIYEKLLQAGITRSDLIITLGGGVVGDLGGFAAATYLRGVPYIQVPTTLLAQIDSSIGGKVAVDLDMGKNLVGSFYHPEVVFIDPELLKTLDKRFLHDGVAEAIKYGCIRDKELFDSLYHYRNDDELLDHMDYIISTCCRIKKDVVEKDEKDKGERMVLNFGHTLGHAIEKYFNYQKYTHGEAVAIGMYWITVNSERLGLSKPGTSESIKSLLEKYDLPYEIDISDPAAIFENVILDKKNLRGHLNLIVLEEIGKAQIYKSSPEFIKKILFYSNK